MRIGLVLLGAVWLAGTVAAQPASDLLQSGIYNQETTGDLDAAIRIYRQILNAGASQRVYAAQAQFHLGECLLRKGDKTGATQAFEAVIRDYPGERDLVARARASMPRGDGLLPAPWKEYEVAEYRWTIPGVDDAWSISYVGPSPLGDAFTRIHALFYSPRMSLSAVDVERDTMRPILASHGVGTLRQTSAGVAGYEYGALVFLLRRMPLSLGWRATVPLVLLDGSHIALTATVDGVEDVVAPAGTFHCYRVRLSAPRAHLSAMSGRWPVAANAETLWYGTDAGRPLVKMESGASKGDLTGLRVAVPAGQTVYRDPAMGYSFVVPSGWIQHGRAAYSGQANTVDLIDPETQMWVGISPKPLITDPGRIDAELRAGAEARRREDAMLPGFTLREGMTEGTLGGHRTLSWIADYFTGGNRWAEYVTWVQSPSTRASIVVCGPADAFERHRERFQPIVDSFRMR
jgi:hypothetical protein